MLFNFLYRSKPKWQIWFLLFFGVYVLSNDLSKATAQAIVSPFSEQTNQHDKVPYYDTGAVMQEIAHAKSLEKIKSDSALDIYQKTLKESVRSFFNDGISLSLLGKARMLASKGQYEKAMLSLQQSIPYCFISKRKSILSEVYLLTSVVYEYQGNHEQTLKYLYWALLLIEKYPSTITAAQIYNNIGTVMTQLERPQQALYYYDKAEKDALQKNDSDLLARILLNKGVIYGHMQDWDKTKYYYQAALSIGIRRKLSLIQYTALMNLGNIYLNRDMPQKALGYLLKTQSVQGPVNPYYLNGVTGMLGEAYFKLHNYKKAEPLLKEALVTANNLNIDKGLVYTHELLAKMYAQSGRYAQAYEQEQACYTLTDTLTRQKNIQNANQLEIKYRTAEKDKDIVEKQLLISKQQVHIEHNNTLILVSVLGILLLTAGLFFLYRNNMHKQYLQEEKLRVMKREQEILILKATIKGEEKERSRLARELHDGVGSLLSTLSMNFNALFKEDALYTRHEKYQKTSLLINEINTEIRKTAYNMMPEVLLNNDLPDAVRQYCDYIQEGKDFYIDLQTYGTIPLLTHDNKLTIYRMVQELIHNVVKHASATHVIVQLITRETTLSITVEDNGIGFDTGNKKSGMGLPNLQARVHSLNGHFTLESSKGNGTTVFIEIDLKNNNEPNPTA